MSSTDYSALPWKFEAFRKYITFEILQQAAASLLRYDGQPLFTDTALMNEFTDQLTRRTGLPWLPERDASAGVDFNLEGTVFRNKGRVFSSFYIFDHKCLLEGENLKITDFGKALGLGYITREKFYREIISRFEYPHPAYQDDWRFWTEANVRLKPFVFILEILVAIYQRDQIGEVSASELAQFAHPAPFHSKTSAIADSIISARQTGGGPKHIRSDKIDRKIGDLLGFLCITGMAFYKGDRVRLNLLATHQEENTYFWEKRNAQDQLQDILTLITSAKAELQ